MVKEKLLAPVELYVPESCTTALPGPILGSVSIAPWIIVCRSAVLNPVVEPGLLATSPEGLGMTQGMSPVVSPLKVRVKKPPVMVPVILTVCVSAPETPKERALLMLTMPCWIQVTPV